MMNPRMKSDLDIWRKARREELIARRAAIPLETQRRFDARVAEFLFLAFPMLERLSVGFYWPMKGEVDPRVAVRKFRSRGAVTALPVVVRKQAPLEFREWHPGVRTEPGVFGLPVPQTDAVVPDALLIPPVGFDSGGFRLGYGGGYFDRTLASLSPQPLKIALAREASRMDTIQPQPHDIAMDYVVTELGVHEVGATGLQLQDDLAAVAQRAARIREERQPMAHDELATLLNTLLEAERAGAKVIAAFLGMPSMDASAQAVLLPVQRDESRNCAVLMDLLRHIDAPASRATGEFLQKALAIHGQRERLAFLNRGQAWVARRIERALPRIADTRVRERLREMHHSHVENIDACERLLEHDAA